MVGILGMLAMPFLIAGILGFAIWRSTRVPRPEGDAGSPQSLSGPTEPR
jgi:hypothetical protein